VTVCYIVIATFWLQDGLRTGRAPLLSGRRKLKVATDGEVCRMALPLRFEALDGRLAVPVPEADEDVDAAAPAVAAAR
jgi:hypothetical protein